MDRFVIRLDKPKGPNAKVLEGEAGDGAGGGSVVSTSSVIIFQTTKEQHSSQDSSSEALKRKKTLQTPSDSSDTHTQIPIEDSIDDDSSSSDEETPIVAKRKRYTQKFKQEWLQQFSRLTLVDDTSFCKICNKTIQGSQTHLSRHESRSSHKKQANARKFMPNLKDTFERSMEHSALESQTKEAEFRLCMFIVEHNMPFLIMEHLPHLLKSALPDSKVLKNMKCSRTKATATVKLMGKEYHQHISTILEKLRYSIIIDEVTDIAVIKCLAILVRYVQRNMENPGPKDRLLTFISITDLTAAGITDAIYAALENLKIRSENMIGFAADNASVMMGDRHGT